jgi:hypothetical protein
MTQRSKPQRLKRRRFRPRGIRFWNNLMHTQLPSTTLWQPFRTSTVATDIAELKWWSGALLRQIRHALRDLRLLTRSVAGFAFQASGADTTPIPTLAQLTDIEDSDTGLTAREISSRLGNIAATCQRLFDEMDFKFLLDDERKVFTIGYNVGEGHCDNSFYDFACFRSSCSQLHCDRQG